MCGSPSGCGAFWGSPSWGGAALAPGYDNCGLWPQARRRATSTATPASIADVPRRQRQNTCPHQSRMSPAANGKTPARINRGCPPPPTATHRPASIADVPAANGNPPARINRGCPPPSTATHRPASIADVSRRQRQTTGPHQSRMSPAVNGKPPARINRRCPPPSTAKHRPTTIADVP